MRQLFQIENHAASEVGQFRTFTGRHWVKNFFALALFCGLYSQSGAAGVYFEETFLPVYVSKNDAASAAGGSNSKAVTLESGLGYDTRTSLGYIWNGILIGVTYNYYQVKTSRPLTADYEGLKTATVRQEYGPTLGYLWGGWRLAGTYFLSSTKQYDQLYTDPLTGNASTDETYKDDAGQGYQLLLGYGLTFGGNFQIGPTLIFRQVTYAKQSLAVRAGSSAAYAMAPLTTKAIDSELRPMISMVGQF